MARTADFTAEEDAILLATAGMPAEYTNRLLEEAGFQPRDPRKIVNRRRNVKHLQESAHLEEMPIEVLARQHKRLKEEQAKLERALQSVREQQDNVARLLREATNELLNES